MAKRQPFELKGVLIVYNCGMVLLSVYMLKEVILIIGNYNTITEHPTGTTRLCFLQLFLSSLALKYTYLCDPLHYGTDEWSMRVCPGSMIILLCMQLLHTHPFILSLSPSPPLPLPQLAAGIWLFYFSKLIEYLDTIFFILRKKNNQITFLHVYHHVSMFFLWWIAAKWFAGGSG